MKDGSYQIIEIKGDNKLDDRVVQAKKLAALALTTGSNMIYRMIAGSDVSNPGIVDPNYDNIVQYPITPDDYGMGMVADSGEVK